MADLVVTVPSGTLTLPADVIVPAARIPDLPPGAVSSVNGETGVVVLDAADVGAATAAQGGLADSAVQPGDLGNAAGLDVGTTTGTVAAGDDSRITGALAAANLDTAATALDADAGSALRVQQDARLSSTFAPVDIARHDVTATRGYVDNGFVRSAEHVFEIAAGGTQTTTFPLPAVPLYTFMPGMRLRLQYRDNVTAAKDGADWMLALSREGSAASVRAGTLTNWLGESWSTESSDAVVSATCSTDGSTLTVSLTNNRANTCKYRVQLEWFTPTRDLGGIACWGDSMTAGAAATYPKYLALLARVVVENRGVGGEDSAQIAARAGVNYTRLAAAVTIPTSGAVAITTDTGTPANASTLSPIYARIAAVDGKLTWAAGVLSFTRTLPGYSVTAPSGAIVTLTGGDAARDMTQVIWAGTNDGATSYAGVVENVLRIAQASRTGRVIVMGVQIDAAYPTGTQRHTDAVAVNAALAATFGDQYLDIRQYLIDDGLTDASITPTSQDNADIANDLVPDSLRTDGTHLTAVGYSLVADQVWAKIQALGYSA